MRLALTNLRDTFVGNDPVEDILREDMQHQKDLHRKKIVAASHVFADYIHDNRNRILKNPIIPQTFTDDEKRAGGFTVKESRAVPGHNNDSADCVGSTKASD